MVNDKLIYGDNPDDPRDPDRGLVSEEEPRNPAHLEFRNRFIPSGLDQEVATTDAHRTGGRGERPR
ncbi:MAG: hypothetical protein USCGTAYLOR_01096 [Chromatiales bacterium USCg_Taylor]|nr:MAG: hypothetical protein USCGTAYLOR_01096 [Chromatiales bacterium USCg_Taylor]